MLKQAKFTRNKEDFVCDVCGLKVHGNGYTNHCPRCLASKHVDINPGDRVCDCCGVMIPIGFELRHGKEYVIQRCQKCAHVRANKVAVEDRREAVRAVASGSWESYIQTLKRK